MTTPEPQPGARRGIAGVVLYALTALVVVVVPVSVLLLDGHPVIALAVFTAAFLAQLALAWFLHRRILGDRRRR